MEKYAYDFEGDILAYCESKGIGLDDFCRLSNISRPSLNQAIKEGIGPETMERAYSFMYRSGFRLNKAKDELFHDEYGDSRLLYHGSKYGLEDISVDKGRPSCDLGPGFYTSLSLFSASSFVSAFPTSSVYLFELDTEGLRVLDLKTDERWMLLVAYYRGYLKEYKDSPKLKEILDETEGYDVIVAPIANNKMFQVLDEFAKGLLNLPQAEFCLSASRLGYQYVLKTQKAVDRLKFLNRYYFTYEEREASQKEGEDHASLIQSKLFLARRKYRGEGKYIEEFL